jgi:hypothetical protein
MNSPTFAQVCERIAAELAAVENERQSLRLSDPQYRAFLANLCRIALTADHAPTMSEKEGTTKAAESFRFPQSAFRFSSSVPGGNGAHGSGAT